MATKPDKKKSTRTSPPKDETPAQRFQRLAKGRMDTCLKQMQLMGQMTGSAYESSDVERRAMVTALRAGVEGLEKVYTGKAKKAGGFEFPDSK